MTDPQTQEFSPSIGSRKRGVASIVLLVQITLLACALRLCNIDESLWLDELHTAWCVSDGLTSVAERAAMGNQGPVYFYLTWLSTLCFGSSELSIRLPSLVLGVLLVPLTHFAIYRWTNSAIAALLGSLLVAIDPELIFYSQEARPYSAVLFLGTISIFAFWQILSHGNSDKAKSQRNWQVIYIVSSTLLVYAHYTAALLLLAELICFTVLLFSHRWSPSISWKEFAIQLLFIAIACSPIFSQVLTIAEKRDDWQGIIDEGTLPALLRILDTYILLPSVVVAMVMLIRWMRSGKVANGDFDVRTITLVTCWLAVPVGTYWVATASGAIPVMLFRYIIVSALAPIAFACLLTSMVHTKIRWLVALTIAGAAVWTSGILQQLQDNGQVIHGRNEDWKSVVNFVNSRQHAESWPVLIQPGLIEDHRLNSDRSEAFQEYCLFPITSLYRIDPSHKLVPLPSGQVPELMNSDTNEPGIWLIIRGRSADAEAIAHRFHKSQAREGAFYKMQVRISNGSLHLFEYPS